MIALSPRHRLSGSRTELAEHCMYWARPDVAIPDGGSSAASRLGSALHQGAEQAEASPGDEVDEEDLEQVLRAAAGSYPGDHVDAGNAPAVDLDTIATKWGIAGAARDQLTDLFSAWAEWWPGFVAGRSVTRELPFAWNTHTWTARQLPSRGPRDYSAALPEEVTCTVDAVIVGRTSAASGDPLLTVVDLKTGRGRHRRAADHAQLATAALCAAHVGGFDRVRVVLASVRGEGVFVDVADLDTWTLGARALLLQQQIESIPTAEPRPGPHCARLYCPALAVCAGPRALARRAPELAAALTVEIRSEAEAAAALACVKPLEAFVAHLKRSAVEWAERHGNAVRMPDGSAMRRVQVGRRSLDLKNLRLVSELERMIGHEAFYAAIKVKRSLPLAPVEKAIRSTAPRGKKETALEEAMRSLEATGGLKETFHGEWREDAAIETAAEPALTE